MNRILFILFIGITCSNLFAQIVDDSTKLVYGAHTTFRYNKSELFNDTIHYENIDTIFFDMHYFDNTFKNGNYYQNIGNTISPGQSLFFNPEFNTIQNLAPSHFSHLNRNDNFYYLTRSPHTKLSYIQGSRGDQLLQGIFTQNISENWNFGFQFDNSVSKMLYGLSSSDRNKRLSSVYFARVFTSFKSKNGKYNLLADYNYSSVKLRERGGVIFNDTIPIEVQLPLYKNFESPLSTAYSYEKQRQVKFFHKYDFNENLGVYMSNEIRNDRRWFEDSKIDYTTEFALDTIINGSDTIIRKDTIFLDTNFYKNVYFSKDTTFDLRLFRSYENEAGIFFKNDVWKVTFGYKRQDYKYSNNYENTSISKNQQLIVSSAELHFIEKYRFKISSDFNFNGAYAVHLDFISKYGKIYYKNAQSLPFMTDNYLVSNHLRWSNNFEKVAYEIYGLELKHKIKNLQIEMDNRFSNINRFIYYNQNLEAEQSSTAISLYNLSFKSEYKTKKWGFYQGVQYSYGSSNIIRQPRWLLHSKIYYHSTAFKNALMMQCGIENRVMQSYFSYAYNPVIQNFYLQDNFNIYTYPLVDVFANFKVKTVNITLKLGHANAGLMMPNYFLTPNYPAKLISFHFGLSWLFFD